MPVTAKHLNRLESIQETIARCEYLSEGLCMHCNDKADLISIACAWAFDEGAKLLDWRPHVCLFSLDATGRCFECGKTP